MKTSSSFHITLTVLLMNAVMPSAPSKAAEPAASEKVVPHQRISVHEYQNFIGNWDDKMNPALCALIQSSEQYGSVFHAAAVMHGKKLYAPDKELFDKEQIVLVAKVMTAPADMEKSFEVEKVIESGDTLMIHYRMNEAKSDATYTVKNFMALRIPKKDYKRVVFLEGGKQVAELKPAEGAWCNIKLEAK